MLIITSALVGAFLVSFALVYAGVCRLLEDTAPPW